MQYNSLMVWDNIKIGQWQIIDLFDSCCMKVGNIIHTQSNYTYACLSTLGYEQVLVVKLRFQPPNTMVSLLQHV